MAETLNPAESLEPSHVRMARSGLDLTVRELAVLSDVNKATIVRIEAGQPVRATTMASVKQTLEERGAQFMRSKEKNVIYVGVNVA